MCGEEGGECGEKSPRRPRFEAWFLVGETKHCKSLSLDEVRNSFTQPTQRAALRCNSKGLMKSPKHSSIPQFMSTCSAEGAVLDTGQR